MFHVPRKVNCLDVQASFHEGIKQGLHLVETFAVGGGEWDLVCHCSALSQSLYGLNFPAFIQSLYGLN
jgi:1,4-dihydroxy-2-naphthoyl-CoA synthase